MSRIILALAAITMSASSVFGSAAYFLSDMLIYKGRTKEEWQVKKAAVCDEWLRNSAFADLRESKPVGAPLDLSCEQAIEYPADDFYAQNSEGLKIRYREFKNPIVGNAYGKTNKPNQLVAPIWLHVHGINGNYLHGARYIRAASRLGFQLVAMELQNHGLSGNNAKGAAYGCRENSDVVAVFDALTQKYPSRDIFITASSMGSMAVANAAAQLMSPEYSQQLVAVSLESPIPSVKRIVFESPQTPKAPSALLNAGIYLAGLRAGQNFQSCSPTDGLKFLMVPTLVQHAKPDDLVPETLAKAEFDALPENSLNRFKVYARGAHSTAWNGNPEEFESDLLSIWNAGLQYRSEFFVGKTTKKTR